MDSAMSLTYTRNNKGPTTESLGIPKFVHQSNEEQLLILTILLLPLR